MQGRGGRRVASAGILWVLRRVLRILWLLWSAIAIVGIWWLGCCGWSAVAWILWLRRSPIRGGWLWRLGRLRRVGGIR